MPGESNLAELVERLKAVRGDPKEWLRREIVLLRYLAELPPHVRVLARGETHTKAEHCPAILVFDENDRRCEAYGVSFGSHRARMIPIDFFHSTVPHQSIAAEVLNPVETTEALQ